jgi:XRE family transcriptional regulator, regulator of sulfur utilization
MIGISTTAYGDIERGKTDLTLSRLYQIAEIFKINVGVLIEEQIPLQQELQQLELEKLRIENDKLRLENQYLREKLAGRIIVDLIREKADSPSERQRIGF